MVLPRPTSSAMKRLTRGMVRALRSGSTWKALTSIPPKNDESPLKAGLSKPWGIQDLNL